MEGADEPTVPWRTPNKYSIVIYLIYCKNIWFCTVPVPNTYFKIFSAEIFATFIVKHSDWFNKSTTKYSTAILLCEIQALIYAQTEVETQRGIKAT